MSRDTGPAELCSDERAAAERASSSAAMAGPPGQYSLRHNLHKSRVLGCRDLVW